MNARIVIALLALPVSGASACFDTVGPEDPGSPAGFVAVEGIRVRPQTVHLVAVGDTARLSAVIAPADATDRGISWESADSGVVSVDADGLVTAVSAGYGVFVTAYTHDGHHEASVNVSVVGGE